MLEGSGAVSTTENTLSPAARMTLGAIFLTVAFVMWTRSTGRRRGRHGRRFAVIVLSVLGGLLVIKGLVELLA
ncbi:MAG TPA: hypothetical protein VEF89_33405 [Solirubrobacteraceae bacterium]|nr:hypothetical protein [Solirubrobacteraceae bacterium]